MPNRYPEEFRGKVLDPVAAGRTVAERAVDLGIEEQTNSTRGKEQLIDTGKVVDLNSAEQAQLAATSKRIWELENEITILKRSCELLQEPHDPKPQKDYPCTWPAGCCGSPVCLLRMPSAASLGAVGASCLADRTDQCRARRLARHLRNPPGPRGVDPEAWDFTSATTSWDF